MKRDFSRALAGFGAKVRNTTTVLRDLPVIADLEALLRKPSGSWSAEFEARLDNVSLALFGITPKDARPVEPHPDSFDDGRASPFLSFSGEAFDAYNTALDAWYDWQEVLAGYEREVRRFGPTRFWGRHGIDVTDGYGLELDSVQFISLPMYVATKELLPGARLTLDGSGRRAAQSAEEWGAALAAEAARFRSSR